MRSCPKCKNEVPEEKQFCQECFYNVGYWEEFGVDYEEKPISGRLNSMDKKRFMYDDKSWKADIRSRRTLKDGSVGKFKNGKRFA